MGLYTRQGVKLLNPGIVLTEPILEAISQSKWGTLYLASSASDLVGDQMLLAARQAPEGEIATADLVTAGGILAVEAGQYVESHHADAYALGAFQGPQTREDRRQRAQRMKIADFQVAELEAQWKRIPLRVAPDPLTSESRRPESQPGMPTPDQVGAWRHERVLRFRRVFARILSGVRTEVGELLLLVDELVRLRLANPATFPQTALLDRSASEGLPDHCFATGALSIAIAARLQWSVDHVRLAGLAGMLADVGMGLVPLELRQSSRALTEIEINRVRRHPAFSVVLLEAIEELPEEVRFAAYQHHERENGSGYPSAARTATIYDLARVVAVADTYIAATAARKYKPPRRPYDAVEELIMLSSSHVFDRRIVRALVESIGLFPVGGYVQMSNGSAGLVVGAHVDRIDRPIVQMAPRPGEPAPRKLLVDLTEFKAWELHVIQAVDTPMGLGRAPLFRSAV